VPTRAGVGVGSPLELRQPDFSHTRWYVSPNIKDEGKISDYIRRHELQLSGEIPRGFDAFDDLGPNLNLKYFVTLRILTLSTSSMGHFDEPPPLPTSDIPQPPPNFAEQPDLVGGPFAVIESDPGLQHHPRIRLPPF
jgi:hypothetical protein